MEPIVPDTTVQSNLPKMIHGVEMITILRVVPMLVYAFCAIYLCNEFVRYISFPRVSRRNRAFMRRLLLAISLFNTIIVWSVFVMLVKDYLAYNQEDRPVEENLSGLAVSREDVIELIFLYGFALMVAVLVYACEFHIHMQSYLRNFTTQHMITNEIGWSIYYLLIPPNASLHRLLTRLDRYYGQKRARVRRLPSLQRRQTMRDYSASETGPRGRATHKLLLPLPSNVVDETINDPIPGGEDDNILEERSLLVIVEPPMRRCISLESMPNIQDELRWMDNSID